MDTSPKLFCFVLMPFDAAYDDLYKLAIKAACESQSVYCERVDEQVFQETILQRVYNQISKADIVVADMSGRNPNVFYEVGYAHALGKITILLTHKTEDIPFDLKHFQHIVYGGKLAYLKDELAKKIAWFVSNPPVPGVSNRPVFDVFMSTFNLLKQSTLYVCGSGKVPLLKFTLHNSTPYVLSPEDYQLGIITPERYSFARTRDVKTIMLPDRSYLHMIPPSDKLLPGSYVSFGMTLGESPIPEENHAFILRLFTQYGTFDYPFSVTKGQDAKSTIVTAA